MMLNIIDRHIGGLEIVFDESELAVNIDRHIGGLETLIKDYIELAKIDRHIGGLEIPKV